GGLTAKAAVGTIDGDECDARGRGMPDRATYFMRSDRIGFRCWRCEDLPLALAIWGNPHVTRLIADRGSPCEEQARQRLAREMANWEAFGVQYWPIFLLDGGEARGCGGPGASPPVERGFRAGAPRLPGHS